MCVWGGGAIFSIQSAEENEWSESSKEKIYMY